MAMERLANFITLEIHKAYSKLAYSYLCKNHSYVHFIIGKRRVGLNVI